MAWYTKRFRRNLVDMHIDDWSSEFLSRLDPETYVENLKIGRIEAPMLYLQSHVGLCYWPTKSGRMHNALIGCEDKVRRIEQLCHKNGMDVVAYYSLTHDNWAHEHHPEWRMIDFAGNHSRAHGTRYGLVCPNNKDYRKYTEAQIAELCDYFDFEGIFFDMTFWPMVCGCDSCRARWEKEVGGEFPKAIDWHDDRWLLFQQKRCEWMGEYAQWVTDTLLKYKPGTAVEHQYSPILHDWRFGQNENIALASTYSGGDLYGGPEQQSFACKLYYGCTQNQPFEYMTSRAHPGLAEHTATKSVDMLRQSVMMTYVHHGACLVIDAIDPVGTLDRRVYERIGKVFAEAEPYEKYMTTGELDWDVALYYDLNGKYNPDAEPCPLAEETRADRTQPIQQALLGAARSLRSHHIPYGVVNNWKFDEISRAKVLVLSDVPALEDEKAAKVLDYVRNGGCLYMSGHCSPVLLKEIFGLEYDGVTAETVTYVSPTDAGSAFMDGHFTHDYPLTMLETQPLAAGNPRGTVLGTLTLPYTIPNKSAASETPFFDVVDVNDPVQRTLRFASIHSNPPGIFTDRPAIVSASYGKGRAVWSAAPIERPDREQHSDVFARIIADLARNDFRFSADAPACVECVLFTAPDRKLLGLVNMQTGFTLNPVHDFTVSVATSKEPAAVLRLPDETPVPFTYADGRATFRVDRLHCAEMYEVKEKA